MKTGKVYLTGGGCGDIGLLTVKALEVLRSCDTVVYDSLVSEELLKYTKADCEKIYVGKRYGCHAMRQPEINALLVEKAREGKTVVRLKGGDPYMFGRGGEEFLAVKEAGICCEEIPGISSAIAVPAAAGIPVTHRGVSAGVMVVTGTAAKEGGSACLKLDFNLLAQFDGTLVILMGMHYLEEITEGLMAAGKNPETPCAVIMEGTTGRQKCLRTVLSKLFMEAQVQGFTSPAVIVIGAVAKLELISKGSDEEAEKLTGISVGVTGTPHFTQKLSAALRQKGAKVRDMSFMEIRETKKSLPNFEDFNWLVFTSPNGVRVFLDKMRQEQRDLRTLYGKQIAVIGPGTAEALAETGMYVDYMPEIYDAFHLAEGLTDKIIKEQQKNKISAIFLRAEKGSEKLPQIFTEKGLSFLDWPLYKLDICEDKRTESMEKRPDYIVFGSAMGVKAYFEGMEHVGLVNLESRYVCIGEMCGEELRKYTRSDFLIAREASIEGIVECICEDVLQLSKLI